jgi:hypothetical protein
MRNIFPSLGFKIAVLLFIPLLFAFALLPRQTETVEAAFHYGYGNSYSPFGNSQFQGYLPTGQIYQYGQLTPTSTSCLSSAIIEWNTQNVSNAQVTVRDPDSGIEKLFASGTYGSQNASWISAGKPYTFTLWSMDRNSPSYIAQIMVQGTSRASCNASQNNYTQNNYSQNPNYGTTQGYSYSNNYPANQNTQGDIYNICGLADPASEYALQHCSGGYSNSNQNYSSNYGNNGYSNTNSLTYTTTPQTQTNPIPQTGNDPLHICHLVGPGSEYDLQNCGGRASAHYYDY